MKLRIEFIQRRTVKGETIESKLSTNSFNIKKEKDLLTCAHIAANKFEKLANVLRLRGTNGTVWSLSKDFEMKVMVDGFEVLNSTDLTTQAGIKARLSIKNAELVRPTLMVAVETLNVMNEKLDTKGVDLVSMN